MANETLNGTSLCSVTSEQHSQNSEIEVVALPMNDSTSAIAFDFAGVRRTIKVEGRFYASTEQSFMDTYIVPINAIQNGNQTGVVYHSDIWSKASAGGSNPYTNGNITVFVRNFTWTYVAGEMAQANYTLMLEEAG